MKNKTMKLVFSAIGIVTSYALLRRGVKITNDRAALRTEEEKEIFKKYDALKKDVEDVEWNEKAKMMKMLECNELYKATKERIFELQKSSGESKNFKVRHHDLDFGYSSGNDMAYRQAIRKEEKYLEFIEQCVLKKIQSERGEEVRLLFESFDAISNVVHEILKRERIGLWKEIFFGKV